MMKRLFASKPVRKWYSDLQSIRASWVYIIGWLFVFSCVYALLKYPASVNTVIPSIAGILSIIFTNYTYSKTQQESRNCKEDATPNFQPVPTKGNAETDVVDA